MPVAGERVDDTHRLVIEILLALPLQFSWSHCNSLGKMTSIEANAHRGVLPGQKPLPKVPGAPIDFAGVLPAETGWPKATLFGQGAARAIMLQ